MGVTIHGTEIIDFLEIAPSGITPIPDRYSQGLYIGGTGGTLKVQMAGDDTDTWKTIVVSEFMTTGLKIKNIDSAGTTATPLYFLKTR